MPTKHAKIAATDTNATGKLKCYANRAPIAQSQYKLSVQQEHTVPNKARQQTQHALHVPKVLINVVKDLNIALIGKWFLCCFYKHVKQYEKCSFYFLADFTFPFPFSYMYLNL